MKASEVKVDMEELKKFKVRNAKERIEFIDMWVNYMKTHSDEEWSEQQNEVINGQISEE